jgi:hypothetical protein
VLIILIDHYPLCKYQIITLYSVRDNYYMQLLCQFKKIVQERWIMPIIPATLEAEIASHIEASQGKMLARLHLS